MALVPAGGKAAVHVLHDLLAGAQVDFRALYRVCQHRDTVGHAEAQLPAADLTDEHHRAGLVRVLPGVGHQIVHDPL